MPLYRLLPGASIRHPDGRVQTSGEIDIPPDCLPAVRHLVEPVEPAQDAAPAAAVEPAAEAAQ
jgi:hypothetical protein